MYSSFGDNNNNSVCLCCFVLDKIAAADTNNKGYWIELNKLIVYYDNKCVCVVWNTTDARKVNQTRHTQNFTHKRVYIVNCIYILNILYIMGK